MFCTFDIFRPIWVKFGISGMHLALFVTGEFRENRCREGHTFLGANVKLHLLCTVKRCNILTVKNALVNSVHCVNGVHYLQLCISTQASWKCIILILCRNLLVFEFCNQSNSFFGC